MQKAAVRLQKSTFEGAVKNISQACDVFFFQLVVDGAVEVEHGLVAGPHTTVEKTIQLLDLRNAHGRAF